jgi:hypothetical protein
MLQVEALSIPSKGGEMRLEQTPMTANQHFSSANPSKVEYLHFSSNIADQHYLKYQGG